MNKMCSKNCEPICGFCSRYDIDNKYCRKSYKFKEKYEDCDCNQFKCFTLDKNYNPKEYLDYKYIFNLFETGDIDG